MDEKRLEVLIAIHRNMVELQLGIERCRSLIDCVLDESTDEAGIVRVKQLLDDDSRASGLRDVLREAIFVLDDSRKASKSKQLENLRKGLIQALAEP